MILPTLLGVYSKAVEATDGFVEFEIQKSAKTGSDVIQAALVGESVDDGKTLTASLDNQQVYYQIQLEIGTPPQPIDFTLDTGSSDLWVMASSNPYCTNDPNNSTGINCTGSIFNPSLSSTFHQLNESFAIAYGDTTRAEGDFAKDTVGIGSDKIINATFAVANSSNASTCVFGIGFVGDEAQAVVHKNGTGVYPTYFNVPALMKHQNLIHTNAYSLWLNDKNSPQGSILFGAVDKAKYEGDLHVMPVYNNYHEYLEQPIQTRVMLNGLSANNYPLAEFNIAVLMDSGTSFAYLPKQVVDPLGEALDFTYEDSLGYYYGGIDTAMKNVQNITLNFSGAPIVISIDNLLVGLTQDDGSPLIIDGEKQAILAIGAAEDSYMNILGDVFLRQIYTVFDLDHYEIAVAQAKVNVTDSDIAVIEASIPNAVPVPNYFSTSTNNAVFTTHAFPTQTSSATSTSSSPITATSSASGSSSGSVTTSPSTGYIEHTSVASATKAHSSHTHHHHSSSTAASRQTPIVFHAPGQEHVAPQNWVLAPDGELMSQEEYDCRFGKNSQKKESKSGCEGSGCHLNWFKGIFHGHH